MNVFIITEYKHGQAYIRKVVNGNYSPEQIKAIITELENEAALNARGKSHFEYDEYPVE